MHEKKAAFPGSPLGHFCTHSPHGSIQRHLWHVMCGSLGLPRQPGTQGHETPSNKEEGQLNQAFLLFSCMHHSTLPQARREGEGMCLCVHVCGLFPSWREGTFGTFMDLRSPGSACHLHEEEEEGQALAALHFHCDLPGRQGLGAGWVSACCTCHHTATCAVGTRVELHCSFSHRNMSSQDVSGGDFPGGVWEAGSSCRAPSLPNLSLLPPCSFGLT